MNVEKRHSVIANGDDDSTHTLIAPHQKAEPSSTHPKIFEPNKQTWALFKGQSFRLVFTVVLVVLYIGTLRIYQVEGNVSHKNKEVFNTVTTVLSLALGLNFLEAFKDMAKVLRWRILANRAFTIRETDLILGGESLMKLLELMWESKRKPITLCVCLAWITLNLLAQASVAMISLTYSMDKGTNSSGVFTSPGMVSTCSLDCYHESPFSNNCSSAPETPQALAHAYGEITTARRLCPYTIDDDIKDAPQDCGYFANNDGQEFALRYLEYNLNDSVGTYPYRTNRIIKASSGPCYQYSVDIDQVYSIDGTDGIQEIFVYPFFNATYSNILPIPKPNAAFDATSYVWNGTLAPQNAIEQSCGPRCVWLYAFQSIGILTGRPDQIFQCPITVSDVTETTQSVHQLSDENARIAAASIALSGRYTGPPDNKVWQQYQLYPWGSYWETNSLSASEVGSRMSQFAVGSLASMAGFNPSITISGTVPTLGYHLSPEWNYSITLAACIVAAHTILVALMMWISRPIIVGGDSNIAVARLLQGLVGRLDGRGSLLDEKELAKAIEKERDEDDKQVVYGVREVDGDGHGSNKVLEISSAVKVRKDLIGGRFPKGTYL